MQRIHHFFSSEQQIDTTENQGNLLSQPVYKELQACIQILNNTLNRKRQLNKYQNTLYFLTGLTSAFSAGLSLGMLFYLRNEFAVNLESISGKFRQASDKYLTVNREAWSLCDEMNSHERELRNHRQYQCPSGQCIQDCYEDKLDDTDQLKAFFSNDAISHQFLSIKKLRYQEHRNNFIDYCLTRDSLHSDSNPLNTSPKSSTLINLDEAIANLQISIDESRTRYDQLSLEKSDLGNELDFLRMQKEELINDYQSGNTDVYLWALWAFFLATVVFFGYRYTMTNYNYFEERIKRQDINLLLKNPDDAKRVTTLAKKFNINVKNLNIDKLISELEAIAAKLYQKQIRRLTFLNADLSKNLPREVTAIILQESSLIPKENENLTAYCAQ